MKLKLLSPVTIASTLALTAVNASAALATDDATDAITEAIASGTVIIAAGFAIGALFLVARIIKRAMSKAG